MRLFQITMASSAKLSVFAKSYDQAAGIHIDWFANHYGDSASSFEVAERNPSWPGLNTQHLKEALALKTAGVGRYDPNKGWTIVPTNAPVGDA